jgi:hypothetical protein
MERCDLMQQQGSTANDERGKNMAERGLCSCKCSTATDRDVNLLGAAAADDYATRCQACRLPARMQSKRERSDDKEERWHQVLTFLFLGRSNVGISTLNVEHFSEKSCYFFRVVDAIIRMLADNDAIAVIASTLHNYGLH